MPIISSDLTQKKTRNIHSINIDNTTTIYEFEMKSWNYMYNLNDKFAAKESALNLFFGITVSDDPVIEISGTDGVFDLDDLSKDVFRKYWVPFLKRWWHYHYTVGVIFYQLIYLKEYNVYVPTVVDHTQGQAYCVNYKKDNSQQYIWKWIVDEESNMSFDLKTIKYDRRVYAYASNQIIFCGDNLMEWVNYSHNVINNRKQIQKPFDLTIPYNSPLKTVLEQYFYITRLKNATLKIEELNSKVNLVWVDKINYKNDEYHNFMETYGRNKNDFTAITNSIEFKKFHNVTTVQNVQSVPSTFTEDQSTTPYIHKNPKTSNITNIDQLWGGVPMDKSDLINTLQETLVSNVGITNEPIHNGDIESIISSPSFTPVIIPKNNSKNISDEIAKFEDILANIYGIPPMNTTSSKIAAETTRLGFELSKHKFSNLQKEMETMMNAILKEILCDDLDIIREHFKEISTKQLRHDQFEIKYHFRPNFTMNIDTLLEIYNSGLISTEDAMYLVNKQMGFFDKFDRSSDTSNKKKEKNTTENQKARNKPKKSNDNKTIKKRKLKDDDSDEKNEKDEVKEPESETSKKDKRKKLDKKDNK